jgi:hypothetical protein
MRRIYFKYRSLAAYIIFALVVGSAIGAALFTMAQVHAHD